MALIGKNLHNWINKIDTECNIGFNYRKHTFFEKENVVILRLGGLACYQEQHLVVKTNTMHRTTTTMTI